jgi:hypothetical protein
MMTLEHPIAEARIPYHQVSQCKYDTVYCIRAFVTATGPGNRLRTPASDTVESRFRRGCRSEEEGTIK